MANKNTAANGFSSLTLEKGVYEGEFRNGMRAGYGKITFTLNGTCLVSEGEWTNDTLNSRSKKLYLVLADGTIVPHYDDEDYTAPDSTAS